MAGLPGTGLGGIFYILLILWMGVRESWFMLEGRTSRPRWARIGTLSAFSAGIVAVLWIEGWLMRLLVVSNPGWTQSLQAKMTLHDMAGLEALAPALTLAPFAVLVVLMLLLHVVRLALPRRRI